MNSLAASWGVKLKISSANSSAPFDVSSVTVNYSSAT